MQFDVLRPNFVRERRASGKPLGIAVGVLSRWLRGWYIYLCASTYRLRQKPVCITHDASHGGLIGPHWMRFTSCRTPIFAQLECPCSIHFKILSDLRRMSTNIIAVLDEDHATVNHAWDTYTSTLSWPFPRSWFPLYMYGEKKLFERTGQDHL